MYSLRYYFIIIIIFEELSYHIMYVYIMLYSWNKLYYYYSILQHDTHTANDYVHISNDRTYIL